MSMPIAPTAVLSRDAESACRLLMATLAQHVRQEAMLGQVRLTAGRLRVLPSNAASREIRAQATVVRSVSITEAFVVGQLVKRVEPEFPRPRAVVVDSVYLAAEDKAISSWPSLDEHFKKWLGIKFSAFPERNALSAVLDARNAIAHGLGELTRRQTRRGSRQMTVALSGLGMQVRDGRLTIPDSAVRKTTLISRHFVVWLDEALQNL